MFGLELANPWLFYIGLAIVLYTMIGWWADTIKEAHEGAHTRVVSLHLRYGMIMFIASEVMFFVAWFWAFFDASLFANEAIQASACPVHRWPVAAEGHRSARSVAPAALQHHHPAAVGHDVTWAHHALLHGDRKGLVYGLAATVALGILFTMRSGL